MKQKLDAEMGWLAFLKGLERGSNSLINHGLQRMAKASGGGNHGRNAGH